MNDEERKKHSYLGDGVYAEFDGFGIWLRTNDHRDEFCHDKIYIEDSVLNSLIKFAEQFWSKWSKNE